MLKAVRGMTVPLITFLAIAGCSDGGGNSDATERKLNNPDGVVQEYMAKIAAYPFPLPEGYQFPDTVPKPATNVLSEPGVGVVYADRYWQCAWMAEWLQHRNDAKRAASAMGWLERFRESDYMRKHLEAPGPENWTNVVLAEAKLGDPTKLRERYAGCQNVAGMPNIS